MLAPRIIPCLLYLGRGLVKTRQFGDPVYVGDPVNTARIFNDSEADELILLDIRASVQGRPPSLDLVSRVASECFMPLTYGGGITSPDQVRALLNAGVEKVAINTAAFEDHSLIGHCAERFGRQAVVAAIDVKLSDGNRAEVVVRAGTGPVGLDPIAAAVRAESLGAGEILLNSVDRDGTMDGYDLELIRGVADAVGVPVIACGGAGTLDDLRRALRETNVSAVAAGSMFVFHGPHRAVLISYPDRVEREDLYQCRMARHS